MAQYQLAGTAALASATSSPALIEGAPVEFRNVIKFTIPATKVSAPLVDFPVALHIDDSAGTNSKDLSAFFDSIRDTTLSYCNDDFETPTNLWGSDWYIDRDKWYYASLASGSLLRYENGKLKINFTPNYAKMQSYFGLSGDFDIQIDFDCTGSTHVNQWFFGIRCVATTGNDMSVWRSYNGSLDRYRSNIGGTSYDDNTSDHTGKMRITRVGTTITTYYWNGSSWTQLRSTTDHSNDIKLIEIDVQTWTSNPNPTVYMDNFTINSGTPLWRHFGPEAKKLYAFDDNNTPLPIDVDTLDHINEKAIFHVKVPYISATVDTNVYIAWDDAKEDNPLSGWTNSVAARQAWDDDYLYVGHMCYLNPYNGLSMRRDQAIRENDLGAVNATNMDEADTMVSSSHGRYINFDTERYNFAEDDWMESGLSNLTIEAYAFFDVVANWCGTLSKDINGARQYALIVEGNNGYPRGMINGVFCLASSPISTGTWYYLACLFEPSTFIKVRQDKAEVASETSTPPSGIGTGSAPLQMGVFYSDSTTYMHDGGMGELRLSKATRSTSWCDVTSDGLHDTLASIEGIKKQLGGTAAVVSTTSTPNLQGPWDLGGTAAVVSQTSAPDLKTGGLGALPVIVVVT